MNAEAAPRDPASADHHRAVNEMLVFTLLDLMSTLDNPVDYLRSLQSRARRAANGGHEPQSEQSVAAGWVDELCEAYIAHAARRPPGHTPPAPLKTFTDSTPGPVNLQQFLKR